VELSSGQIRSIKRQHRVGSKKVVPQHRRFDRTKAADLICMKAYQLDITRAELAVALNVSIQYVNKLLITDPKGLKPHLIRQFGVALGMTREELRRVFHAAALEQGYAIGPFVPFKKYGESDVVEHTDARPERNDVG
jgi:hypothetical protein